MLSKTFFGFLAMAILAAPLTHASETLIEVGNQTSESHSPRIVVAVEHTNRDDSSTRSPQYYSVRLETAMSPEDGEVALYLDVEPLHISRWAGIDTRVLRTEIRRDLDLGIDGMVTIHGIGWTTGDMMGWGTRLEPGAVGFAIDVLDFRLAIDLLGLRYLNSSASGQEFLGAQLGQVLGEVGGSADVRFSRDFGLRIDAVYAGLRYSAATVSGTAASEYGAYASVSAALRTLYGDYGAFAETGFTEMTVGSDARSYDYLKVGFSGRW